VAKPLRSRSPKPSVSANLLSPSVWLGLSSFLTSSCPSCRWSSKTLPETLTGDARCQSRSRTLNVRRARREQLASAVLRRPRGIWIENSTGGNGFGFSTAEAEKRRGGANRPNLQALCMPSKCWKGLPFPLSAPDASTPAPHQCSCLSKSRVMRLQEHRFCQLPARAASERSGRGNHPPTTISLPFPQHGLAPDLLLQAATRPPPCVRYPSRPLPS
jgi:hypothetical protein